MTKEYTTSGYRTPTTICHYGVTIQRDQPTTGVIHNHSVEFLSDEIFDVDSIDLAWEDHLADCDDEDHDHCGPDSMGTVLIGGWIKDSDGRYSPDKESEYSAIVGEVNTQVVWSRHTDRAALCSPCYPGQADLETPGDVLAFTLPADLLGT